MKRKEALAYRRAIEGAASLQSDEKALEQIDLYPKWEDKIGQSLPKDERLRDGGKLYKVIQPHTAQADWAPHSTPALFVVVSLDEWPAWVQPTGAHDAYNKGAKVAHKGDHWTSDIDGNVWEPGVYGWTKVS